MGPSDPQVVDSGTGRNPEEGLPPNHHVIAHSESMVGPPRRIPTLVKVALVVTTLLGLLGVLRMFFGVYSIPARGMVPTLLTSDKVWAYKGRYGQFGEAPRPGDIALFALPRAPNKAPFIQRIVGVPGDVIELRDRVLYRNGQIVPRCSIGVERQRIEDGAGDFEDRTMELYLERLGDVVHLAQYDDIPPAAVDGVWRLRAEEVFVMGDNRDNSYDSRMWGVLPLDHLEARAFRINTPKDRARSTDPYALPSFGSERAAKVELCLAQLRDLAPARVHGPAE